MEFDRRIHSHPTEEILEEFYFDRVPNTLAVQIEEHLLICRRCQSSVTEIDQFVSSLKAYGKRPDPSRRLAASKWRGVPAGLGSSAMGAAGVSVLALAMLALVLSRPASSGSPVAVSLSSMRGGADLLSPAPAGKLLELTLEAPGVSPGEIPFQIRIVDIKGKEVWKGAAQEKGGRLTVRLPKPLSRGTYWVRLYSRDSILIEEFGVVVK